MQGLSEAGSNQKDVGDSYTSWTNTAKGWGEGAKALDGFSERLETQASYYRGYGRSKSTYTNIDPQTSVRPQFDRSDYEYFRPGEAIPKSPKEIIRACINAYREFSVVRYAVDLMSDFATQGIQINHPTKKWERFLREWAEQVQFAERSERFLSSLFKTGHAFVYRTEEVLINRPGSIPVKYSLLNPLSIEFENEGASELLGAMRPVVTLTGSWLSRYGGLLEGPGFNESMLPHELLQRLKTENLQDAASIPLPEDSFRAFFYKKDDWETWAVPFIYSILKPLIVIDKAQRADLAALEGAISNVRVWKLGSLEHRIAPSAAAAARLSRMLENNVGSGTIDLVWGPDLELVESSADVVKFLDPRKYDFHMEQVYAGLGIPRSLAGNTESGFTNNFVALQTLIQRLEYGRAALLSFWGAELKRLQAVYGFRQNPIVTFDHVDLSDPAARNHLILNLYDRGLISHETLLEYFGETAEVEVSRIKQERLQGDLRSKGPFDNQKRDAQTGRPKGTADEGHRKQRVDLPKGQ